MTRCTAHRITFIGYSLPRDDLHSKCLFKHALETRYLNEAPEIVVVDYRNRQREPQGSQAEANYQSFFGRIKSHSHGFDSYLDQVGG